MKTLLLITLIRCGAALVVAWLSLGAAHEIATFAHKCVASF